MEYFYERITGDKILQLKADKTHIPLNCGIELLPICNMDCKMCYVRKSKDQVEKEGGLLSCDTWIQIIDGAIREGMLYLVLTGGEPLIYPEFKRLYATLASKGVILSVNTNGTLINEEWADFFAKHGCRRLNITLYGKDDETYGTLCRNPKGFSQVMYACKLLKERNVPFRFTCSVTPANVMQLPELFAIAKEFDVPLVPASYMFPANRKQIDADDQYRLSPENAAASILRCYQLENPEVDMALMAKQELEKLGKPHRPVNQKGFTCRAGHSSFWVTWKGDMLPCGMFEDLKISLREYSFKEAWDFIVSETQKMHFCDECKTCEKRTLCHVCPASCYNETGRIDGKPVYMCQMIDELIKQTKQYLTKNES